MNRIIILDAQVEPVWPHTFLGTLTSNFRYVLKYRFINKSVVCCPRPVIFMATRKLRTSNPPSDSIDNITSGFCQFCPDRWQWTFCYSMIAEVSSED